MVAAGPHGRSELSRWGSPRRPSCRFQRLPRSLAQTVGPLAEPVSASPRSRSAGSGGRSECEHQPQSRLDGLHHLGRQRADSLAEEALIDGNQL